MRRAHPIITTPYPGVYLEIPKTARPTPRPPHCSRFQIIPSDKAIIRMRATKAITASDEEQKIRLLSQGQDRLRRKWQILLSDRDPFRFSVAPKKSNPKCT